MLIHLKETPSTNTTLKALALEQNLPHGTVLYTDHQTQGKGQVNTVWESEPSSNLLMSIVLKPSIRIENQYWISKIISVALIDYLKDFHTFAIKWPNDIYVNGKKIAGILIENSWLGSQLEYSIVGIGLNINQVHFEHPKATSLALLTGTSLSIETILKGVQTSILKWIEQYELKKKAIDTYYFKHLLYYQIPHIYTLPNGEQFLGQLEDIQEDGSACIKHLNTNKKQLYTLKTIQF